jgi:hypothetical protein
MMGLDSTVLSMQITRTEAIFGKKILTMENLPVINGSLSPWHRVFSGCSWRNCLQIWKAAAYISNKQLHTANRGWSTSLGLGEVLRNPCHKNSPFHNASD